MRGAQPAAGSRSNRRADLGGRREQHYRGGREQKLVYPFRNNGAIPAVDAALRLRLFAIEELVGSVGSRAPPCGAGDRCDYWKFAELRRRGPSCCLTRLKINVVFGIGFTFRSGNCFSSVEHPNCYNVVNSVV